MENEENYLFSDYEEYRRQMDREYGGTIIRPATYEQWVAFNEVMDRG